MSESKAASVVIPPGWMTKQEAIPYTGLSMKSIERHARERGLERREITAEGRKPFTCFRVVDLDRIKAEKNAPAKSSALVIRTPGTVGASLNAPPFKGFLPAAPEPEPDPDHFVRRWDEKPFLTLRQALAYTGLPEAYFTRLKEQMRGGSGPGLMIGKRYYFRRADLDQL